MKIKWLGHSCFMLTSSCGTRIMTDPFSPDTLYKLPPLDVDAVTVSHAHHDHNYTDIVGNNSIIVTSDSDLTIKDVSIKSVKCFHDECSGALRGDNRMFIFEIDGIRILHCGDIGEQLDKKIIDSLGKIDVMLVPIGGIYTINGSQAVDLMNMVKPKIVIPMHYENSMLGFKLEGTESFVAAAKNWTINSTDSDEIIFTEPEPVEPTVIFMNFNPVSHA